MGSTANYYMVDSASASTDILLKLQSESFYKGSRRHQLFVEGTLDRKIYEESLTRVFTDNSSKARDKVRFGEFKDSYQGKEIRKNDLALDTNVYVYNDGTFEQFDNPYYTGEKETAYGWILGLVKEYKESIDKGETYYSNIDCYGIIDTDITGHIDDEDLPISSPDARDHETLLLKWALPFMCYDLAEKRKKNELRAIINDMGYIFFFTMQQGILQGISMDYANEFGKTLASKLMSQITGKYFMRNYTEKERWKHGKPVDLPEELNSKSLCIQDYLDNDSAMTDLDMDYGDAARYLRSEFNKRTSFVSEKDVFDVIESMFYKKKEGISKARIKEVVDNIFKYSNGHILYFLLTEYLSEYIDIDKSDEALENYLLEFFESEEKFSRFADINPLRDYVIYRKKNNYSMFKALHKVDGEYVFAKIK